MSEKSLIQINSMSSLALGLAVTFLFGLHIHMARNNVTTVEFHLKDIIQRVFFLIDKRGVNYIESI